MSVTAGDPGGGAVDNDPAEETAGPEEAFGALVSYSRGETVLHPSRDCYLQVVGALYQAGYTMCVDVCAADYLLAGEARPLPAGIQPERYEVVANFINHGQRSRIRVRVQVPGTDPTCDSLWSLHAGAEGPEREAYDLFGIAFTGHPDMTRILMPETWQGHPLRKDYAIGRIPVQFKGAPST